MPKLLRSASVGLLAVVLLFTGCATDPRYGAETVYLGSVPLRKTEENRAPHDDVSYWDGDAVTGKPQIIISLTEQRAYFYKSGRLVGISSISTGREGFGTPTGRFKVVQKNKDHRSSLYGDYVDAAGNVVMRDIDIRKDKKPPGTTFLGASMPYFMRIHGGTGMHAGFLPGYPASHGCIRMPDFMAAAFFNNTPMGTPVEVVP